MSVKALSRPVSLITRLEEGTLLFRDPVARNVAFLRPDLRGPYVELRQVARRVLETRAGERWRFERSGGRRAPVLELVALVDRYPPARMEDVFRGDWSWNHPTESTLRRASNRFGLTLSPHDGFARFDWRWWSIVGSRSNQIFLRRQAYARPRWTVLEKVDPSGLFVRSGYEPVAINPLEAGLLFVFGGREWEPYWRASEGFWIVHSLADRGGKDRESWMAVARDPSEGGWIRLNPGLEPPTRTRRVTLPEAGQWVEQLSSRLPGGRVRHVIEFEGGRQVSFHLPDPEDRRAARRIHGRKFPTIRQLANRYARLPPDALRKITTVHVHTRNPGGLVGELHGSLVHHYPPFDDLLAVAIHEVLGHGREQNTKAFHALWVGAMIADGGLPVLGSLEEIREDFALTTERYLLYPEGRLAPHRFAVLDDLYHPDGSPITRADIRRALSRFRVHDGRLEIGPRR